MTSMWCSRRVRPSLTSIQWRLRASARSASHAVSVLPSIAANGRCSGNCVICGENGASTERMPL
jgi:hypothetical protein